MEQFAEAVAKPQVFINFRGDQLRHSFVTYLKNALERNGINTFIDAYERRGRAITDLFKRIENSKIALAIFSSRYTESQWCLEELATMKKCMEANKLVVIPIFYMVPPSTVRDQMGDFGDNFRLLVKGFDDETKNEWTEALKCIASKMGITYDGQSDEDLFIDKIVKGVKEELTAISSGKGKGKEKAKEEEEEQQKTRASSSSHQNNNRVNPENITQLAGLKQRLKELEEKLDFTCKETRIVAVIGMPGIGKTTLVKKLYDEWQHNFQRHVHMVNIHENSNEHGPISLQWLLLKKLLGDTNNVISDKTTLASVASELLETKVFLVLDDVSSKTQIDAILGDQSWIKEGSKIVVSTRDKRSVNKLQHTYLVPRLDLKDGIKHLCSYAFKDHNCPSLGNFEKLSTQFVDYARGNPLALKILGRELLLKEEDYWSEKLDTLAQIPSPCIEDFLRVSYDELSEKLKETFLVVACFFRSGDEYYVRSLLDSSNPDNEISDLADKLLISISSGRVEMHDLLYTFAKKLCSSVSRENNWESQRIWNQDSFTAAAKKKDIPFQGRENVRGILLDLSELTDRLTLNPGFFSDMCNLRYLKIYNSQCSQDCDAYSKLNLPDGLKCSLENVRYLHWLQFSLEKLPTEIDPKNLIELSLPYSKIEQLWENVKDISKLKWVDLSHSRELREISGLVEAQNLQRLNLEGCTNLTMLPEGMQKMECLTYLNLRGCTNLASLPQRKLSSLKILILSYCSNLKKFDLIPENLEALYLEGTAIKRLSISIANLQKLVLLNMKDCKALMSLPNCIGKLRALEELILSGCSKLESFPELEENMKSLRILLLDGTAIKEMPRLWHCTEFEGQAYADMPVHVHHSLSERSGGSYGISSSLLSLCLSGNNIESLQANISKLYHLKWLDLKNCKRLKSLPELPPNLKCLDAHGCDSLEKVASPLALLVVTGQIHCTFIFTNCKKLDQAAKSNIISYTRRKGQLISDAHNRYNGGFVLESLIGTCFPGCEVPALFNHQAFGSLLEPQLPRHWCNSKLIGIALCAVILFPEHQQQSNRFLVKCTCEFKSENGVCISFSSIVGGWNEPGDEPRRIESAHVFIGYTSWVDISKHHMEVHGKGCIPSKVSLKFEVVTDGTTDIVKCEVRKCGFTLVYTPDDIDDISPSKNENDISPSKNENDISPSKNENDSSEANPNKPSRGIYAFYHGKYSAYIFACIVFYIAVISFFMLL